MKMRLLVLFLIIGTMLAVPVLAEEAEEALPMWFRLFEPVAIIIAAVAVGIMISTYKRFEGGLKKGYGTIITGTVLVALSMVWKFIVESGVIEDGLMAEVVLELFIIVGIIVIAFGSKTISKTISNVK